MDYKDLLEVNNTLRKTNIKGKDYVEVNERVKAFRMLYPEGSILTDMISNADGVCIFKAEIRSAEGFLLASGHAYEKEGSTFINTTSYIENCETSAVGRALGMLGIGIDASVASFEEVSNAQLQQKQSKTIKAVEASALEKKCTGAGIDIRKLCDCMKVEKLNDLTYKQYDNILGHFEDVKKKCKAK